MKASQSLALRLDGLKVGFMTNSLLLIVLLMPYHAFLSTWFGTLIGPLLFWKSWKEILLVLMVVAALSYAARYPLLAKRLLRQPLTIAILAYAALHLLLAIAYQQQMQPTLAGLMTNLRFLAFFLVAQLVLLAVPDRAAVVRQFLTRTLLISTVVISVFGLAQVTVLPQNFLTPFGYSEELTIAPYILIDEQEGALRAFATLRGPNTLGMFLLLPIALLTVLVWRDVRRRMTIPALIVALAALLATGSRSAWIGAFVTVGVLGLVLLGTQRAWRYTLRWGIPVLAVIVLLVVAAFQYPPLRLAIFHSNPGDPTLTEGSTDAHVRATTGGVQDALAYPFGRGPGQAGPASFYADTVRLAENYYVQISQEVGVIGLILFLYITFLVARKLWRASSRPHAPPLTLALLASFWGIAAINILLHGWADDPTSLVWWGLAGLVLTPNNHSDS